jgi:hypothetical protein
MYQKDANRLYRARIRLIGQFIGHFREGILCDERVRVPKRLT